MVGVILAKLPNIATQVKDSVLIGLETANRSCVRKPIGIAFDSVLVFGLFSEIISSAVWGRPFGAPGKNIFDAAVAFARSVSRLVGQPDGAAPFKVCG